MPKDEHDLGLPIAMNPIRSPMLKIRRARDLIQELDTLINAYIANAPCNLLIAPHPEIEGQKIAVAKVEGEIPERIVSIAGDAIHNLRSSLDHIVCCVADANGRSMNGVSFPFAGDSASFEATSAEKIRKLPVAAKRLVQRLRPYRGGNDFLYLLNALDIQDKHRALTLCTTYLGRWDGTFSCDHPIGVSVGPYAPLEEGVHLFTFPAGAKFEQKLKITFTISFSNSEGIAGQPVIELLSQFASICGRIVGIFERKFFK